jgi:selenocysteine lyase/cysteine desulfurase
MISLRTGCFCNPGAGEAMFNLRPTKLKDADRHTTIDRYLQDLGLPVAGGIRVSFGLASTFADAHRFLRWLADTFRDAPAADADLPPRVRC